MENAEKIEYLSLADNTFHETFRFMKSQRQDRLRGSLEFSTSFKDWNREFINRDVYPCKVHLMTEPETMTIDTPSIIYPILGDYTEPVIPLPKKNLALHFFDRKLGEIPKEIDFYYDVREVKNRPPGYVIDLMIVIPDSNRKLEYQIYSALRDLTIKYIDLLFNFRIIRRRGRPLKEIIPEGYLKYV